MHELKKHKIAIIVSAIILIAAIVAIALLPSIMRRAQINEQFEIAQQYLNDLDYEGALLAFTKILEIDPNHEEARKNLQNVYLDYIHAKLSAGQFDHAEKLYTEMRERLGLPDEFFSISVTAEPTCGKDGTETWTSAVNGQTYDKTLAATGEHTWDSGNVTTAATCAAEGVMTYVCTGCNTEKMDTIAKNNVHTYDNGKITREATCAEEGEKTFTCSDCGDSYTEAIAKKTTHSWKTEVTKKATCAEEGERTRTCKVCGETKTEAIKKNSNHTWDAGKVIKVATCGASGTKTVTCTVCKKTKTQTIAATGKHTWDAGNVVKAATCYASGAKTVTCTVCKKTTTQTIAATSTHTWNTGRVTKEATILSEGIKTFICQVCGNVGTSKIARLVDTKTTVYTSDKVLYLGRIPVYGVMQMNGLYYMPLEYLDGYAIDAIPDYLVSVSEEYDLYDLYIKSGYRDSNYYMTTTVSIPDNQFVGTGTISKLPLVYNGNTISGAICTLNGDFPMVCLNLIGAIVKEDAIILDIPEESGCSFITEKDILDTVIPTLRKNTTRETVIAIHDYVVNSLCYTPDSDTVYQKIALAHSQYTMRTNIIQSCKYGVCEDYAILFRLLCQRLGIPCILQTGYGNGEPHGWNKVYIDGEWFYVDCTWDDPIGPGYPQKQIYRTDYLLVDAYEMMISHYWTGADYPMQETYNRSWELLDCNNITSADMFRKCLIAQMMQKKTNFSLRTVNAGAYGGRECVYQYNTNFYYMSWGYNYDKGTYDFYVEYYG